MPANLEKSRDRFLHAVGKLPPEEWDGYVAGACDGDAELEQEVGRLLKVHREAGSFLERPAPVLGATGDFTPKRALGMALVGPGEKAKGLRYLELSLEKRGATLGPDHPETLQSMNDLCIAYWWTGEAVKRRKEKLGLDHADTLSSMDNLALALRNAGKIDLALPLYEEALKLRKAKLGLDHADTRKTTHKLTLAYQDAAKYDLTLLQKERRLEHVREHLGPDHSYTLSRMNNVANAYGVGGKLDMAVSLHEQTVEKAKATLGPNHRDTLVSMHDLALAYLNAGKLDRGLLLLEQAVEKMKAKQDPTAHQAMNNLAKAYRTAGKLDHEENVLRELAKERGAPGDHATLALNLLKQQKYPHAVTELAKLAKTPVAPPAMLYNVACAYSIASGAIADKKQEYADRAMEMLQQAVNAGYKNGAHMDKDKDLDPLRDREDYKKLIAALAQVNDLSAAGDLASRGLNLLTQRKYADAEPVLRQCLTMSEKQRPNDWTTFNTKSMLGGALLGQKKYAEAEPLLLAGYEGMKAQEKAIPPQGRPRLTEAVQRLVELYDVVEKKEQAAKWRQRLAEIPKGDGAEKKK